jgi:F-type H+-transporting ATPase subunit delta
MASDLGARYARALFDLALDTKALAAVEADLTSLKAMLGQSQDLRALITSPRFSAQDKSSGLAAILARAKAAPLTVKFMGLLAANGRTAALPMIIDAFAHLAAERRGQVSAEVVTAVPLTKAQSTGLAAALRTALGKDPEITARVDPAILGGLKVRVGSRLYDASLKSKLDSLKYALKRA